MSRNNLHATALLIGDRGIMIMGASGSGKTTLALTLVAQARAAGMFARIVSDDQMFAEVHRGQLICLAPPTIAGLAEIRGVELSPVPHEASAIIDLAVRLVPAADTPRYHEPSNEIMSGVRVPLLVLAERNTQGGSLAVFAWLRAAAFG